MAVGRMKSTVKTEKLRQSPHSHWLRSGAVALSVLGISCSGNIETVEQQPPSDEGIPEVGDMEFHLDLPNNQSVSTIDLHLECVDQSEDRVLELETGLPIAQFGGLTPGDCTVTMTSETSSGASCSRSESFTVIANETVDVTVTLICQGINESPEVSSCPHTRIRRVYAAPSDVLVGEDTTIQVETIDGAVVGAAMYSFMLREQPSDANGTLDAFASCEPGAATCGSFSCTALGASPEVDSESGLLRSDAWISVTLQDDECIDTAEVRIPCLQEAP
jgi:hypothetical protein